MIGSLDSRYKEVTIVGAGISGLLAAYYLDQAGYAVTLLEKSPRAGGLIRTSQGEHGIFESAAQSVLATRAVRELCAEIGVPLVPVRPGSKARYIFRGGKRRRMPLGPLELAGAFRRACFARGAPERDPRSLSLEEWGRRFLGAAAFENLITPFVGGIYGVIPAELTVGAAFPRIAVSPGRTLLGSVFSGGSERKKRERDRDKQMMAPEHGMGSLAQRLVELLEVRLGERFRLGSTIERLPDSPNVLVAVPAREAARLLASIDGAEEGSLSSALASVSYTSLVSVTAFVPVQAFRRPIRGVGVLLGAAGETDCLGILFNSSSFPGRAREGFESFTLVLGGSKNPALSDPARYPDSEVSKIVESELARVLGARMPPAEVRISRQPFAIPKYNGALEKAWDVAREGWSSRPGRLLFGNFTGQVSLRGLVESARALAAGLHSVT